MVKFYPDSRVRLLASMRLLLPPGTLAVILGLLRGLFGLLLPRFPYLSPSR